MGSTTADFSISQTAIPRQAASKQALQRQFLSDDERSGSELRLSAGTEVSADPSQNSLSQRSDIRLPGVRNKQLDSAIAKFSSSNPEASEASMPFVANPRDLVIDPIASLFNPSPAIETSSPRSTDLSSQPADTVIQRFVAPGEHPVLPSSIQSDSQRLTTVQPSLPLIPSVQAAERVTPPQTELARSAEENPQENLPDQPPDFSTQFLIRDRPLIPEEMAERSASAPSNPRIKTADQRITYPLTFASESVDPSSATQSTPQAEFLDIDAPVDHPVQRRMQLDATSTAELFRVNVYPQAGEGRSQRSSSPLNKAVSRAASGQSFIDTRIERSDRHPQPQIPPQRLSQALSQSSINESTELISSVDQPFSSAATPISNFDRTRITEYQPLVPAQAVSAINRQNVPEMEDSSASFTDSDLQAGMSFLGLPLAPVFPDSTSVAPTSAPQPTPPPQPEPPPTPPRQPPPLPEPMLVMMPPQPSLSLDRYLNRRKRGGQ